MAQTSLWIDKIRRMNEDGSDWKPNRNTIICGAHFVSKTMSTETNNPDYIPSIFPEHYKNQAKTENDVARHERGKVKTLRHFGLAPPVDVPIVAPPGPTILEKLQNLDLSDLTPEAVIVVQSLVIRHLKSMMKKKLPDIVKTKLNQIDGYVTNCFGEHFRDETNGIPPATEGMISFDIFDQCFVTIFIFITRN